MSPRETLAAVNIELISYRLVLCLVILPVFGLAAPVFFIRQAVVETYRLIRRLAALVSGVQMPQVAEINFKGHAFLTVAIVVTVLLLAAFAALLWRALAKPDDGRGLPDAPPPRRFRELPSSLASRLEAHISSLWLSIGDATAPPRLLCFASTGPAACVTGRDGAAIALSTGLIDRLARPEDRLADAILLHEMAHVRTRDAIAFRRAAAFVSAFRRVFWIYIVAIAVIYLVSTIAEVGNLAGIEQRSPSLSAFLTRTVRDLIFPYASMVLVLRYVALTIMLTELRADLTAALALGGLDDFARTVRQTQGYRPSRLGHVIGTLAGTKVAHLSADERLNLLERPARLFTPKYRYFVMSIALSLLLLVDGSLAFSGFDWIVQVGLVATVAALNAMTMALFVAAPLPISSTASWRRRLIVAATVTLANALFLLSPSEVMGTTSTMVVAFTDPNFQYSPAEIADFSAKWYAATLKPFVDAMMDGRALLWSGGNLALMAFLGFGAPAAGRRLAAALPAAIASTLATTCAAAMAPFATFLLLPRQLWDARTSIEQFALNFGPLLPTLAATVVALVVMAVGPRR